MSEHDVSYTINYYGMSCFPSMWQTQLPLCPKTPFVDAMLTAIIHFAEFGLCDADHGADESPDVTEAAHKLQDTLDHSTDAATSDQEERERRARVKDLFFAMDKDGNGKLDVGEFRGWSLLLQRFHLLPMSIPDYAVLLSYATLCCGYSGSCLAL